LLASPTEAISKSSDSCKDAVVYLAGQDLFPPEAEWDSETGIAATDVPITAENVKTAYRHGIFPYHEGAWHSPEQRGIIRADVFVKKSSRGSTGRLIRKAKKNGFKITFNKAFDRVINNCANIERKQTAAISDPWITGDVVDAYTALHYQGDAHSVEVWDNEGNLIAGAYGVLIDGHYSGESAFTLHKEYRHAEGMGILAIAAISHHLNKRGISWLDTQNVKPGSYIERLGAESVLRAEYVEMMLQLANDEETPTFSDDWQEGRQSPAMESDFFDSVKTTKEIQAQQKTKDRLAAQLLREANKI
jgi:leucyl/phenylalanyl-tRNA--protein transferase